MSDLATQDAPFGLNQVTFTPGERVVDRLFEGEEAVLHAYGIGSGGGPKVVRACKPGARS